MSAQRSNTGTAAQNGRQYRAFLSYSHADEQAAGALHRWLEGYRIPVRLVGAVTAQGPVTRRLVPIFRDRAELPAASSLDVEVQSALKASDALLVLCSPDAAASRWVNAEIALFRRLHPDRPIIAAIARGEPEESFPPALVMPGPDGITREPIAADFRPSKDGRHLARLKIVAGLTGLGLDHIIQRDAQRQIRRVIGITFLAVVLALLMALMLVFAIRAQREADAQRRQAEGLIEFMLTDLRDKLKGVGRLDVLESVNERALDYYADQSDLESLPADSLERRARILHAMGEDDHRRGDVDGALSKFEEASRVTATLLKAAPEDPTRIYGQAQSAFWVGYVKFMRKDPQAALPDFESYRELASKLVRLDPKNSKYQRELAYAQGNLCSLALASNGMASQLPECRSALASMLKVQAMAPHDPDVADALANRYAWYADALRRQGHDKQALAQRLQQLTIIKRLLAADPKNATYRQAWMLAQHSTALVYYALGDVTKAERMRRSAREEVARLIASDPENNDWQNWRKRLDHSWAEAEAEEGGS
ncbi:toll/interleukin-1 receptor domain-containing protein [Novosphingobium sp. 1949]|uniref:Toll/interleukin-1 receptor domain-containing protein n=1 Tax=Novosphingobium organovorum TaxID=2930092 RepID=A0ABT0BA16_9SPHN|nr:toll/interleukin-1 receptor domain-containing protein [Novosphingobium organovorum]MCJ2181917.1 toll/interleukin-1 receptor domain-containing protein [Novosphingobium organovorum]